MRWPVFAIFAFVFVVAQLSFRNVLRLEKLGGISPDLVACLAVFISLFASRNSALWACWILGLVMDLAPQAYESPLPIVGPNALGYVAGSALVLHLRTMVFRRRAVTIAFLTLLFLILAGIVGVVFLILASITGHQGVLPHGPVRELGSRTATAVYSAIVALLVGAVLSQTVGFWSFQQGGARRW